LFVFVNYRLKFHISIVFDVSSFRIFRFRMIGNFDTVYRPETSRFRFRTVVIKQNQNQYQCFFDRFRPFSSLLWIALSCWVELLIVSAALAMAWLLLCTLASCHCLLMVTFLGKDEERPVYQLLKMSIRPVPLRLGPG
jgi:hypothetical protein